MEKTRVLTSKKSLYKHFANNHFRKAARCFLVAVCVCEIGCSLPNGKTVKSIKNKGLYIGEPIPIDTFNKYWKPYLDSIGVKY